MSDSRTGDPGPSAYSLQKIADGPASRNEVAAGSGPTGLSAETTDVQISMNDGFFPSPRTLSEYQKIDPSLVERSFSAMEKEQNHRHAMDRRGFWGTFATSLIGQICAVAVATFGLWVAYAAVRAGAPWSAAAIAALDLGGLTLGTWGIRRHQRDKRGRDPESIEDDEIQAVHSKHRTPNVEMQASRQRVTAQISGKTSSSTVPPKS